MNEPNPVFRYSIEPHGEAHALYWGRSQQMHGYNLCRISDLSHNCDLSILQKTLNEGIEADGLRQRIAELEERNSEFVALVAKLNTINNALTDRIAELEHTRDMLLERIRLLTDEPPVITFTSTVKE